MDAMEAILTPLAPRREQNMLEALNRALELVRALRDEPRAPGEGIDDQIQAIINELTTAKGLVLFGKE